VRKLWIPTTHGILMVFNFIVNNPKLNLDGAKAFCSFSGMILLLNLLAQVT
jgi:hypothetical protein